MMLRHFIGCSVTRTVHIVHIGAVALWYQFVQTKVFIAHKYCKSPIFNQFCSKPALYRTLLCHLRYEFYCIFSQFSPVKTEEGFSARSSKFNYGTFESKCSCMSVPNLMCVWRMLKLHCAMALRCHCGSSK